jgi:transcriptional regulator with XRE-family HTH domain
MNNTISTRLSKLMKERDISQNALSRATGVAQPTINRILCEVTLNPRHDSMERLANFFDVTPGSMYGSPSKEAFFSNEASLDELCENIERLSASERSIVLLRLANNSLKLPSVLPFDAKYMI